ncbi:ZIP family metal transporter [Candidatus Parcubacteria bacterium]|nr:ZIP family metal transporter [Patescibacteria group bacterium]MCG2689408.1 ZIP family metal transporter [Candidatus Parcubacteria bacterium]
MLNPIFASLFSILVISLISIVGVFLLFLKNRDLKVTSFILVSFASGALFGDAFIHLIPESFAKFSSTTTVSALILLGIILFFILEKFICWRHCHLPEEKAHHHPLVLMNIFGDGLHNFIDGAVIASSFMVSPPLGIATAVAVLAHEIPQEIGDFGILLYGGLEKRKAFLLNLASGATSIFGALLVFAIGDAKLTLILLPLAAGGFLYIAGSDLVPELKHHTGAQASFLQLIAMLLGIAIMFGLKFVG